MVCYKLTQEWLDRFCASLNELVCRGRELAAQGMSLHVSIRDVCREMERSHMTYYRWMRAYQALGCRDPASYSETEQRLHVFGTAIEAALTEFSTFRQIRPGSSEDISSILREIMKSMDNERNTMEQKAADKRARRNKVITALETRTHQLTGGRGHVTFKTPKFTKKRVNQKEGS